jgi:cytochrome c
MGTMKSVLVVVIGLLSGAAMAVDMPAAGKYCLACHAVASQKVGPSYKSVADKYRNNPEAANILFKEVRSGKHNELTKVDMPAQGVISTPDLKQMIAWILSR